MRAISSCLTSRPSGVRAMMAALKRATARLYPQVQRNPDYFEKDRPLIDEYIILSTPDAATRMAAFRTGQSDIIWLASPSEVEVCRKTNPNVIVQAYHNTLAPFGLAVAQSEDRQLQVVCHAHRQFA